MPELDQTETKQDLYERLLNIVKGDEFVNPFRFGETSFDQNPKRFIDRSDPNYQESLYAEPSELPSLDTGGIAGQIRGLSPKITKIVRKAMQNELKARGIAPFEPSTQSPAQRAWIKAGEPDEIDSFLPHKDIDWTSESNVVSRLLRGTWYRGQSEYPSGHRIEEVIDPVAGKEVKELVTKQFGKEYGTETPVFAGMRAKHSNLGEPHGISLSYDPTVSAKFNAPQSLINFDDEDLMTNLAKAEAKTIGFDPNSKMVNTSFDRAKKLAETTKVSRVMPLYGEPPEGKILQVWKPEHGAEFRKAYVESGKEMSEKYPEFRKSIEMLSPGASGEEVANAIQKASSVKAIDVPYHIDVGGVIHPNTWKVTSSAHGSKYRNPRDEFNSLMSQKLKEQGWKGVLHSPHRYGEYELRMFDPYDVMYIDKRAVAPYGEANSMVAKSVPRLAEMKEALKREHEAVTEGKPKSLRDWYQDITREEILGLPKASNAEINDSIGKEFDIEDIDFTKMWNKD